MSNVSLEYVVKQITDSIKLQMESRAYRGSNELRTAALLVLRGQRSGRIYRVPGTKRSYQASAPGEPPAVRTGIFRLSWQPKSYVGFGSYISRIETNYAVQNGHTLGDSLENGTSRMAPRPHHDRILEQAEPKIVRIYNQPYF